MKSPTAADGLIQALRLAGGGSFFACSFTPTAVAPISRIHSGRITTICLRHGNSKEM